MNEEDRRLLQEQQQLRSKRISVVVKNPKEKPQHLIIVNTLSELQKQVGGYLEVAPITTNIGIVFMCNEEGKLKGLEPNIKILGDIVVGPIMALAYCGENITGLNSYQADFAKRYLSSIEVAI